jgi:hypothetical protein
VTPAGTVNDVLVGVENSTMVPPDVSDDIDCTHADPLYTSKNPLSVLKYKVPCIGEGITEALLAVEPD